MIDEFVQEVVRIGIGEPKISSEWDTLRFNYLQFSEFSSLQIGDIIELQIAPKWEPSALVQETESIHGVRFRVTKIVRGQNPRFSYSVWNTNRGFEVFFVAIDPSPVDVFSLRSETFECMAPLLENPAIGDWFYGRFCVIRPLKRRGVDVSMFLATRKSILGRRFIKRKGRTFLHFRENYDVGRVVKYKRRKT